MSLFTRWQNISVCNILLVYNLTNSIYNLTNSIYNLTNSKLNLIVSGAENISQPVAVVLEYQLVQVPSISCNVVGSRFEH